MASLKACSSVTSALSAQCKVLESLSFKERSINGSPIVTLTDAIHACHCPFSGARRGEAAIERKIHFPNGIQMKERERPFDVINFGSVGGRKIALF